MNKNTKYKLFKLLNALLAMLLAASVVCVVVASTMTGIFGEKTPNIFCPNSATAHRRIC